MWQPNGCIFVGIVCSIALCAAAGFTHEGHRSFLRVHNKLRSDVAMGRYVAKGGVKKPPATNMKMLLWNSSLADSAQKYAETCPKEHSEIDNIGESLFWIGGEKLSEDYNQYAKMASDVWKEEFQKFDWSTNNLTATLFKSGVGHATQMVWADTDRIGCGAKLCGRKSPKIAVVCHYYPAGNTLSRLIYDEGKTCSSCPTGTTCNQHLGLCAPPGGFRRVVRG
ncbi:unnamed protein product [Caenorhabditis auriculariae]|uniref:SCP domain-containing protein n=1 Tax=Caenorhabditis auriculariae TaxID=2777116 RepID=A0A8S1HHK9_9PELO|nr:unnamed protein product [Caenorhabditis auriculariae]